MSVTDATIRAALDTLANARGPDKTFCPSEAARAVARDAGTQDWRALMPDVRRVAATMALVATQKGRVVDPLTARGPIRLGLPPQAPDGRDGTTC